MAYSEYRFPGFGRGLNLKSKVDAALPDEAIDALNVEYTKAGAVRQRDGYDNLTSVELTTQPDSLSPYTSGTTRYLVVGNGQELTQLDTSGTIGTEASTTQTAGQPHFFAEFGSPGSDCLYCANGTDEIRQLSGTTFSIPDYEAEDDTTDVAPKGKYLAVWRDRLVSAEHTNSTGFTTANNKDTVRFSNAGDPRLWTQNSYIQLSPGDGEPIMNVIAWRELLFVFKQTKFFVFNSIGTDSGGNPVFNYRPVDNNIGLASARAVCAGRDGVYFMDRKGVYKTTGGDAQCVSEAVDPIFYGGASPFFQGGTLLASQITNSAMTWNNERVYLAYTSTSTTNNYMLVFDTRDGWWTLWNIPASCLGTFRPSNTDELVFGYSTGSNYIGRYTPVADTYTNDDGTAITSRWQSGWWDAGTPNDKTIRQTRVSGEGKVTVGAADDFQTTAVTPSLLDFSVSQPLVGTAVVGTAVVGPVASYKTKLHRVASKGKVFSLMYSNSTLDQPWAVHRTDCELREVRTPALSVNA